MSSRAKAEPIRWDRIEQLQRKSHTGGSLSEVELRELESAYKRSPKKYGELHRKMKRIETRRLQGLE